MGMVCGGAGGAMADVPGWIRWSIGCFWSPALYHQALL